MKINITVDCTPEEARTFCGLPDLAPYQKAFLDQVQERMEKSLQGMTPEAMGSMWQPLMTQGFNQAMGGTNPAMAAAPFQQFWGQMMQAAVQGAASAGGNDPNAKSTKQR
jgi:hypothetical protein